MVCLFLHINLEEAIVHCLSMYLYYSETLAGWAVDRVSCENLDITSWCGQLRPIIMSCDSYFYSPACLLWYRKLTSLVHKLLIFHVCNYKVTSRIALTGWIKTAPPLPCCVGRPTANVPGPVAADRLHSRRPPARRQRYRLRQTMTTDARMRY